MLMRVKGIKAVTVRKNGRTYRYYYHRATNKRINSLFGTAAFAAEVATLDARAKELIPRDGSLKALIVAYRRSPHFTDLKPRTRSDYDKVFNYLAPIDEIALFTIDGQWVCKLIETAFRHKKRRFANYVLQVVRLLFAWGKPRGYLSENPAEGVQSFKRPKGMARANRPWTDEEREIILDSASIELRAMIALGMFAGLREGDACTITKAGYDGEQIEVIASKNNEMVWLPAHFRLRAILKEASEVRHKKLKQRARRQQVVPIDPPTLTVTSRGHSWTEAGFRASFFKLIRLLTQQGKVRPGLTFHGLRHTMGKWVIEAGGTKEDVGMILGDRSLAMAQWYSREHEKKERVSAAMSKLEQTERKKMENRADDFGKLKSAIGSSEK
jgi:integrase